MRIMKIKVYKNSRRSLCNISYKSRCFINNCLVIVDISAKEKHPAGCFFSLIYPILHKLARDWTVFLRAER